MPSLYKRLREWQRNPDLSYSRLTRLRDGLIALDRAQGERAQSDAGLCKSFMDAPCASFIAAPDSEVISHNPSFERLLGAQHVSERPTNLAALCMPPDSWEQLRTEIASRDGLTWRRIQLQLAHGTEEVLGSFWSERLGDGALGRIHGTLFDRDARAHLEATLGHAKQLEYTAQMAGELAHDFNNLLTIILSVSELMLMTGELSPNLTRRARSVVSACQRAAALTTQLLSLSRKLPPRWPAVPANQLAEEALALIHRLMPEVDIRPCLGDDAGALRVDTVQLEQVLVTLVIHTRDALPPGNTIGVFSTQIQVDEREAQMRALPKAGGYAVLAVGETSDLEHLFADERDVVEMFGGDHARTSGLGLTSAQGVVRHAGGQLAIERNASRPPRFALCLPLAELNRASVRPPSTQPEERTRTILVAEDEELVRQLTCMLLRELGYTVLEASNGVAALELANSYGGPIHLLLTDVMMPGLGGVALSREIRKSFPDIRVLFMSGHTEETLTRQGLSPRDVLFLAKPFTKQSLASMVRRALHQAEVAFQPSV